MINEEQSIDPNVNMLTKDDISQIEASHDLSLSLSKAIRYALLLIICIVLIGLIYLSYSLSIRYLGECNYVYTLGFELEEVKGEYIALMSNKKEIFNGFKHLEKEVSALKASCSTLQVDVHHTSSALGSKLQTITTLKAKVKHREELIAKFAVKETYEKEMQSLKDSLLTLRREISKLLC